MSVLQSAESTQCGTQSEHIIQWQTKIYLLDSPIKAKLFIDTVCAREDLAVVAERILG